VFSLRTHPGPNRGSPSFLPLLHLPPALLTTSFVTSISDDAHALPALLFTAPSGAASRARRARPAPRPGSRAPCRRRPPRTILRASHGRARLTAPHCLNPCRSRFFGLRAVSAGAPRRLCSAAQGRLAETQAALEVRAGEPEQCASRLVGGHIGRSRYSQSPYAARRHPRTSQHSEHARPWRLHIARLRTPHSSSLRLAHSAVQARLACGDAAVECAGHD
jgi:hypothetical protein